MTDHEGQESMAGTRRPIIEVKNLRKEYPVLDETVVALERINLTIPQGQICCIYGESGSGKSTLLNQLAGMEKPTKGGVRIGGVPISRLNERQLAEFRQKTSWFRIPVIQPASQSDCRGKRGNAADVPRHAEKQA